VRELTGADARVLQPGERVRIELVAEGVSQTGERAEHSG
jgi:hypothetical protein